MMTNFRNVLYLKELRNCNQKLFLCPPQKEVTTQQTFQTAIFLNKCTLTLIKLNIYMKKTKFKSHKQYLCCVLFSGNVETNIQTKMYYIFLALSLKRNGSQTFKCSSSNKPFLQCICYWYNLLRQKCFFILCDNWKTLFFIKIIAALRAFPAAMFPRSLREVVWKRSIFYNTAQHSNSTMLIPKFKNLLLHFTL